MTTLRIENLGPIKDSTQIPLTEFMLLLGPQSSGKSTFMKVLCFCRWIEKSIMVSTADLINQYTHYGRFLKELKQFHRLNDDFFSKSTKIEYESDLLTISYNGDKNPKISRKKQFYKDRYNTKVSYIPAERNLIASFKNIDKAYRSSERDVLFNFIYEWDEARNHYTLDNPYMLSVTGGFSYYNLHGNDRIIMENGRTIPAFYASSGIQSVMPLEVMSQYFLSLVGKRSEVSKYDLSSYVLEILSGETESEKLFQEDGLDSLRRRLLYQSAQIFIEEPEQNLFPESQRLLLLSLTKALQNASSMGSRRSHIFMTTHSPYLLSVFNVLYRLAIAKERKPQGGRQGVLEESYILPSTYFSAYFIHNGKFMSLLDSDVPMFDGTMLDGVSDWVDEKIDQLNEWIYGKE